MKTLYKEDRDMIKILKVQSRLLLFALLTVFSLLLLGAAKIDSNAESILTRENKAIMNNLIECNKQLYKKTDTSWRKILHKKPMLILRIEASDLP